MPDRNLKVALLPHAIITGDVHANLQAVEAMLPQVDTDTDLLVLPEMFNAGYTTDTDLLNSMAESNDGSTIKSVERWVEQYDFAIWGGFIARDGNNIYNRGFMVNPGEETRFYDKRHLFRAGGEQMLFTQGMALPEVVEYRSWRLRMAICYDIRFPVWNRARANNYDVLIVPANWAHARFFAWKQMLLARAIENQAFVVGCNREGNDIYGEYRRGDSQAFNNWGDDIADRRDDGTMYATLHAEQFNIDRQRFAPWRDADDFKLYLE